LWLRLHEGGQIQSVGIGHEAGTGTCGQIQTLAIYADCGRIPHQRLRKYRDVAMDH